MTIKRIKTNKRMSQAVVHNNIVTTAGQVAQHAVGEDAAAQTKDILSAIDELLAAVGTDKSNLISATIWLSNMDDFDAVNSVWDAWVVAGETPTRACLQATLAAPQFNVEIMVTAAVD